MLNSSPALRHRPDDPGPAATSAIAHVRASFNCALACSACCLKRVCLPAGVGAAELEAFADMAKLKRRIRLGRALFRAGDPLEALYAVHSGALKTASVCTNGQEKVTAFYLPGEVLGLDAISGGVHRCDATALEDSEVCVIPFPELERMASAMPVLQQQLFRLLSDDISRDHGLLLLLGSLTAEQRLAAFLLSLSRRYRQLGYSPACFLLRMSREEIGSYLGMQVETVSRLISSFQRDGLISVDQREIRLKDIGRMTETAGGW